MRFWDFCSLFFFHILCNSNWPNTDWKQLTNSCRMEHNLKITMKRRFLPKLTLGSRTLKSLHAQNSNQTLPSCARHSTHDDDDLPSSSTFQSKLILNYQAPETLSPTPPLSAIIVLPHSTGVFINKVFPAEHKQKQRKHDTTKQDQKL